jgi:1,2-phenylacetyl-CoA epoxidase catalytic subunit
MNVWDKVQSYDSLDEYIRGFSASPAKTCLYSPDELTSEQKHFLIKALTVQLGAEFGSAFQEHRWALEAPTPFDRVRVAQITADELRHGRDVCRLLHDLGYRTDEEEEWTKSYEGKRKLDVFKVPIETWPEMVMYHFLIDRVGVFQNMNGVHCLYFPIARWHWRSYEEEAVYHIGHARDAAQRLVATHKAEVQEAFNKWWPLGLDMFGRSDSENSLRYIELGLKKWGNEELRQMYSAEVRRDAAELGLEVPDEKKGRRFL